MPATTPGGYPYAEPTDPLVQWPATSRQLAEGIESLSARVHSLPAHIVTGGGATDAQGRLTVDLTTAGFTQQPVVMAIAVEGGSDPFYTFLSVSNLSPTGAVIWAQGGDPAGPLVGLFVHWVAIGT
jgi:hypothetical protein